MAADPRRFPGLLFLHISLIVLCLLAAIAVAVLRTGDAGAMPVVLPANARTAGVAEAPSPASTMGPLAAPPSPPISLDADLAAHGYDVPDGAAVYAVRVVDGADGRVYQQYQAGGGALSEDFWPASSIKVLAALGALDFARSLGFTGAANVTFVDGPDAGHTWTLRSIYEAAIRDSSNYDYDILLRVAGLDRLNSQFLVARNGFPATSITRSYAETDVTDSPTMVLQEGAKRTKVPARKSTLAPECERGNCSNLFEMAESVRRIVLNDQLPPEQRFNLDPSDIGDLRQALLDADGFFPPAVTAVLGGGAKIYDKPGDADGLDCLDVALIQSAGGKRYLLAATVPHASGGCDALVSLAQGVLTLLA